MKYIFTFDADRCCACFASMIDCIDRNDIIEIKKGDVCFRKTNDTEIYLSDDTTYCAHLSMACMYCVDAPCITSCLIGCIRKDSETGFTINDKINDIGCKSRTLACPFGVLRYRKRDGKWSNVMAAIPG